MANGIPLPAIGALTFDAEGQEGGRYDSRQFHVPTAASGLTIGRGYDMKLRNKSQIRDDLAAAGVAPEMSALISQAAGMAGGQADEFIAENHLEGFRIEPEAQLKLFEIEYARQEADARRLATKSDVTQAYGVTDWDGLNGAIRETVVDLRFRGDYTPTARRFLQTCIVDDDLGAFAREIGDQENWPNVPDDRFNRRKAFCDAALSQT
jgi:hypothetical protein